MDSRRIYDRQNSSSGTPSSPSSPVNMISPLHRHARAGSTGSAMTNVRRAQNNATKAAAQRLAQVMSHTDDDDEDEDDVPLDYSAIAGGGGIGLGGGRPMPARSPMVTLYLTAFLNCLLVFIFRLLNCTCFEFGIVVVAVLIRQFGAFRMLHLQGLGHHW